MKPTDKIRAILKEDGWTQQKVANRLAVSQSTVNRWLGGSEPEGANRDNINDLYAEVFEGDTDSKIPLKGYVGAGQAVYPIEDGGDDLVEAPPGAINSTVAVSVRGDSMLPVYQSGWLLYYSRQLPPQEMINKQCVAQLADGRLLVKTLKRGTIPGHYTLVSTNAADIEDVLVEWVSPIDWIRPR